MVVISIEIMWCCSKALGSSMVGELVSAFSNKFHLVVQQRSRRKQSGENHIERNHSLKVPMGLLACFESKMIGKSNEMRKKRLHNTKKLY